MSREKAMAEDFSTALEFAPEWDDEPFTMVPTQWAREGLYWEDMGFLFWLRTHRKGFRFTETFMVAATPGGRDKLRTILRRLEKEGKLQRRKDRDARGRVTGVTFIVPFPTFSAASQRPEKPSLAAEQAIHNGPAVQTDDGSSNDGKPVNGPQPAEMPTRQSGLTTENPSPDYDQGKHYEFPGQTNDGFSNDGKPNDGESTTKEEQLKGKSTQRETTTTTRGSAPTARTGAGAEPDGSGSSSGSSGIHHGVAVAVLREAVDPTAARRLTSAEVEQLCQRVAALLEAGALGADLRAQLAPVTSSTTKYPFARLRDRLDEIAANGANPLTAARPSAPGVAQHGDGSRRLTYRPCGHRDCTGGGSAVGAGSGPYRRRINAETGFSEGPCDHLVTTSDGQIVTCHPDAALTTTGVS
jgi:hypothetical protein